MKEALIFIVASIFVGVLYGVIFSVSYPLVSIDVNLAALFAVLGVLTCLAIGAVKRYVWKGSKQDG